MRWNARFQQYEVQLHPDYEMNRLRPPRGWFPDLCAADEQTVLRLKKALREFPWAKIQVSWFSKEEKDLCLAKLNTEELGRIL